MLHPTVRLHPRQELMAVSTVPHWIVFHSLFLDLPSDFRSVDHVDSYFCKDLNKKYKRGKSPAVAVPIYLIIEDKSWEMKRSQTKIITLQ